MVQEAVMVRGYDKLGLNYGLLLGLPFREGVGVVTRSVAPPHRELTQNDPGGGSFAWGNLANGLSYLEWVPIGGGATDGVYLSCPAADSADLNFTSEDYSIGGWINWGAGTSQSEIIIGRYATEVDGWDIYLNAVSSSLSHRHHHSSLGTNKSECFSAGWVPGSWDCFGVSRSGLYPLHYRNGVPLVMDYGGLTMLDPDTCNRDVVMGARGVTLDANWYYGMMWNIRVWNRALSQDEWQMIFEMERKWFEV